MSVFSLFDTVDYTFIETTPTSGGLGSVAEYDGNGIFKERSGTALGDNRDSYDVTTTLHVRPDEAHIVALTGDGGGLNLVGHAVRYDGQTYRIDGVTTGKNFDTGVVEFYRATLNKVDLWQSELPIE